MEKNSIVFIKSFINLHTDMENYATFPFSHRQDFYVDIWNWVYFCMEYLKSSARQIQQHE